jgi:Fe2+ or Zn2+ uptake regulation protein
MIGRFGKWKSDKKSVYRNIKNTANNKLIGKFRINDNGIWYEDLNRNTYNNIYEFNNYINSKKEVN